MTQSSIIRAAIPGRNSLEQHRIRSSRRGIRGFSLLELLVVLAVAMILTSLLLPALNSVRENVNRVVCASNLRQISIGLVLFAEDNRDRLPDSVMLSKDNDKWWKPQELMASHQGTEVSSWDGLGVLYEFGYCGNFECFYCPSHTGKHPLERYKDQWESPGPEPIYTNYHYSGPYDWETKRQRFLTRPSRMIFVTDGLRTLDDLNHPRGINIGFGDGSVRWRQDVAILYPLLPNEGSQQINPDAYKSVWNTLEQGVGGSQSTPGY